MTGCIRAYCLQELCDSCVTVSVPGPMTPAEYGEFGHVSAVLSGDRHLCVGSLITPSSLLTTATCCSRLYLSSLKPTEFTTEFSGVDTVRVGDYYTDRLDEFEEDIAVKKIIVHEYFDTWTNQNDICLLILENPADITSQFVSTIGLPSDESDYIPGEICQVTDNEI